MNQGNFLANDDPNLDPLTASDKAKAVHAATPASVNSQRKSPLWAARNRILLWYCLLLVMIFAAMLPAFRTLLLLRIDERVRNDMQEKTETFDALIQGKISNDPQNAHWYEHRDHRLRPPSTQQELSEFFDVYLSRQVPEDEVYLLAFLNETLYKSSPRARPEIIKQDSALLQQWAKQTTEERGERPAGKLGKLLYIVRPIQLNGQLAGVFVVAHTTSGEQMEALEAVIVVAQVAVGALVLALILGWFASGQVLAPLSVLSSTVRSISDSDLTQRIPIHGTGELTDLANTFNDMMERLQNSFVSQRNFISDAGHELRTPITIIRGHLELMGDDPLEQQETLAIVMDELDRMNRLVDDLSILAKAERPDFLHLEVVNLEALTTELFTKACALADRQWVLEKVPKGHAVLDRQRITQAVMNLAQNATQHTQTHNTITLGAEIRANKIHFWVRDTGEGITLSDQQRIFERFARAANSRRRSEGAGLGLSIFKAIVQAHEGTITLHSQVGKGAMFSFTIPLDPPPGTTVN
jgi:signal transduction histidine kinase